MSRLKSEVWVKAYMRTCQTNFVPSVILNRGDSDAGAIYIKVNLLNGLAKLFIPAPAGFGSAELQRSWISHLSEEGAPEQDIDTYIAKQKKSDPDIWVIETEDPKGQHFLQDFLVVL